ncbi:MAG: hypothetical protein AB1696_14880 [Planctomycetota bacterium]
MVSLELVLELCDENNREAGLLTVSAISGNQLTLTGTLTKSYAANAAGFIGFVGKETGTAATDFFIPDTSKVHETFDDAYIELAYLGTGSTSVPYQPNQNLTLRQTFAQTWFNNKYPNCLYLVGGESGTYGTGLPVDGVSSYASNYSFVYIGSHGAAKVRDIVNHELVHQWDTAASAAVNKGHDNNGAHDNSDQCLMDDDSPRNGVIGRNDQDDTHELCIDHLYRLRDFVDGI